MSVFALSELGFSILKQPHDCQCAYSQTENLQLAKVYWSCRQMPDIFQREDDTLRNQGFWPLKAWKLSHGSLVASGEER